jgi:protein-L-isoaspartate(D-aspartate) O-methyltransferase
MRGITTTHGGAGTGRFRMKPLTEKHLSIFRTHMVEVIDVNFDLLSEEIGSDEPDARVRAAFLTVPRHLFVPQQFAALAYQDTPLPIGFDKTISQPFIAALMIHLLAVSPGLNVLEVGTGLGYQAAILSEMGARVWSVEIVEEFAEQANVRLSLAGYENVEIRVGDGSRGWMEYAPFDRILVTAAAEEVPDALLEQLSEGGRLVMPLGGNDSQNMTLVTKGTDGLLERKAIMAVRFTQLETAA